MASVSYWLDVADQVAFIILAAATLIDWIRHRDPQRTFLVLALVTLTVLVMLGPITRATNLSPAIELDIGIIVFLLSGYFLVLFRDSLLPLGRRSKILVTVAVAMVAAINIAASLPSNPAAHRSGFQAFATVALVVTWLLCVSEPIYRLAVASIGRPAVEGARLRALALGYAGLIALVLVGTLLGSAARTPDVKIASDLVALLVVPMLYASFAPPAWLRRIWSYPEQQELRRAMHDLLLFSPDRVSLATKAVEWGARLVGGAAAFIVDLDGTILAARGITPEAALQIARGARSQSTVSVPLDLQGGDGALTIMAGPFTPVFGQDEITLLHAYAVSIAGGLNRVSLTQRIAALEKAKGEFMNLASHELRAPMTVIKGYLTMMAGGALGELPEKFTTVLPMLVAKSDEVTSMVEQMIEASRLEEGRLALKKQKVDIAQLTQDAIDELQPILTDHRVIEFRRPDRPVVTTVDPDRYQIVVRNLLSNAIKYSPPGTDVEVKLIPDSTMASVEVTDQGIGIARQDQERLFTRFGRIETKETAHIAGTGLGLWLSKEIARMHDGDLKVDSEVGKGSTFTLEIPLDNHNGDNHK